MIHRRLMNTKLQKALSTTSIINPMDGGSLPRRRKTATLVFSVKYRNHLTQMFRMCSIVIGSLAISYAAFWGISGAFNYIFRSKYPKKIPYNPIYRVPESTSMLGDRSDRYVLLRKEVDAQLDDADYYAQAIKSAVSHRLPYRSYSMKSDDAFVPYDIYNCPETPPAGYPYTWKTVDILNKWPTNNVAPPMETDPITGETYGLVHNSLCIFDYHNDFDKARAYRDAALPFIVVNDPAVLKSTARWNLPNYMEKLLGNKKYRTEYSVNNHFLYYTPPEDKKASVLRTSGHKGPKRPDGWKEPTQLYRMTFSKWWQHANVPSEQVKPEDPHWYFRLLACGTMAPDGSCDENASEFLYDELPFFQPRSGSLYLKNPRKQQGIHCRFGMKGVTAENHYDPMRNAIVVLSGSRRYILSHPNQCGNLALYPDGHRSARHSKVDWSNPDLNQYPAFADAQSNEVVLQAGEVLYLPAYWFHHIISLDVNMQCNTRSGYDEELYPFVEKCGF